MNFRTLILPLIILMSLSCNQSTTVGIPAVTVSTYPFTSGVQWNYQAQFALTNIRGVRPGVVITDTVTIWNAHVTVIKDTLLRDGIMATKFVAAESLSRVLQSEKYFRIRNDTLFPIAWSMNYGIPILPKRKSDYSRFSIDQLNNSLQQLLNYSEQFHFPYTASSDSLYYTSESLPLLIFPLRVGLEWDYLPHSSPAGQIHKKVTGIESVSLPAGARSAFVIEWTWENYPTISETEYIDDTGLLKRTWLQKSIILTTETFPDSAGMADLYMEYVLTSSNVTL
jgi:hypothetical protein